MTGDPAADFPPSAFARTEAELDRDCLDVIRASLDDLDRRIAPLLRARADLVEAAAEAKARLGLPARDREREARVLMAFDPGLPREMARGIVRAAAHWQIRRRGEEAPPSAASFPPAPAPAPLGSVLTAAIVSVVLVVAAALFFGFLAGRP